MGLLAPVPRFTLSTRSSPMLGPVELARIARRASLAGLDVDLAVSRWRRRALREAPPQSLLAASLWLPANLGSGHVDPEPWLERARTIVVEEADAKSNGIKQIEEAIRIRRAAPDWARVALAVRPRNADGGRGHLTRLSMLRSIVEEWDLDLALDMTGAIDWLWEAEAAVARLTPRLRIIRVAYPLPAMDAHVRSRMTQRTLAACADTGFDGWIGVVVGLPFWRWRDGDALERSTSAAVERLGAKFGVVPSAPGRQIPERSSAP